MSLAQQMFRADPFKATRGSNTALGRKMRIETSRLWLRPYTEANIEDAIGVLGDAETMSFYPRSYSPEEVANIVRASIATYQSHEFGRFAVIAREDGCYIGECGITLQDIEGVKEHEVGYRFAKRHWGKATHARPQRLLFGMDSRRSGSAGFAATWPATIINPACRGETRDALREAIS